MIPCQCSENSSKTDMSSMHMRGMAISDINKITEEHSGHNMNAQDSDSDSMMDMADCCEQSCDCVIGSCSSAGVATAAYLPTIYPIAVIDRSGHYFSLAISQPPASLFRPPITG